MKLFILTVFLLFKLSSAVISIENNRYKGLVIAIHNSVEEDHRIVDNLKELFTSASELLYRVSRNRSYFDDIAIVVPANWTQKPDYVQTVGGNRFSVADFRIDQPNAIYGNNPYTLQADSCGKSGQYVHITPEFIQELHGNTAKEFGDPGKALVHEWAHYRYGVFDEYADSYDSQTRPFYFDAQNNIRATGCSENIPGWLSDEGASCKLGADGLPNENCQFHPDINSIESHSSIMYMHYLPSMEGFCDDTEELKHNTGAPNKQNVMCGGQSTWSVVSNHPDFLNDNNPPRTDLNPKPKFRVLQPSKQDNGYFVLVLDVSGSMSGRRIAMLHRAARRFILSQVPDQSQLAIVTFSSVPRVLADLTLVTNKSRQLLADRVPSKDDAGNTAISSALQQAIRLLAEKHATEGGVIILISDGEENVHPFVADILPAILRSRVRINTIAIGKDASQHLEKLVRLTGGHGFFFSNDDIDRNQVATLQSAFFAAVSTQADIELQPVELNNKVFDIPSESERRGKIVIDAAIGKNTQFIFTAEEPSKLDIALKSPSKKLTTNKSKYFTSDVGTATFVIPMAEVGKWEYRIKNNMDRNQVVTVTVISEPKDIRKQPIRIKSWISDVEFNYEENAQQAKIFAEVKKKYTPILGATVVAVIERPYGDHVEIELRDNGAGADITKNDGIYSSFFTQFQGSGRYSVSARVVNDGNARVRVKKVGKLKQGAVTVTKFDPGFEPSKTSFESDDMEVESDIQDDHFEETMVDDFQRCLMAGAFLLNGWRDKDVIPPNRVIDLKVKPLVLSEQCVNLTWTAAGNDMDTGIANRTEIRCHSQADNIYKDFQNGYLVTEKDVVNGTLTPVHGGTSHWVTVCLSKQSQQKFGNIIFFALRNYDDSENVASISNVAEAHFSVTVIKQKMPYSQLTLFVACGVVGAVVLFVIGLIVISSLRKRYSQKNDFYKTKSVKI